jgi:hypothetical protein
MKARGCALSGRLVLELMRSVALLLALAGSLGLMAYIVKRLEQA